MIIEEGDRDKEIEHMNTALRNCGSLDWVLTKGAAPPLPHECTEKGDLLVTLPYVKGLSEEFCRIFKDHGSSTSFKYGNTLQQCLVSPKDPIKKGETCGVQD